MVSQYAVGRIEELQAAGLKPTVRDVIRLNAFGLRIEAAKGRSPVDQIDLLPRVAYLFPDIYLRQPTIGHEIWIDDVMRYCDPSDMQTKCAIWCFALSHDFDKLPDAFDPKNLKKAVDVFNKRFAPFTFDQLITAVGYCRHGCDPSACEQPANLKNEDDPGEDVDPRLRPIDTSVAIGTMLCGVASMTSASLHDLKSLTIAQLRELIRLSAKYHGVQLADASKAAEAEFEEVLWEIRTRLEKERDAEKAKGATNG